MFTHVSRTTKTNQQAKTRTYLDLAFMCSVDKRDERDEADEHVDLLLHGAELFGHPGADEQAAEVPAVLARRDEGVAPPEGVMELLQRPPRGLPPHQLGDLQLTQQAADDLHVLRQAPARVAVAARRQRGLHDHGHQPERVDADQLRHVRGLPKHGPQAARADQRARHGCFLCASPALDHCRCVRHYTGQPAGQVG